MDDITLIADSPVELQRMLNVIHEQANRYHVIFGQTKCKVLIVASKETSGWSLGNLPLETCQNYKYLGETISHDGKLSTHLQNKQREVVAETQTILSIASDDTLSRIGLETSLKLLDTCIIPCLLYGSETWLLSKSELEMVELTQRKAIKRMLQVPKSTPTCALFMETGLIPMSFAIDKRQLIYYHKITKQHENFLARKITITQKNYYGYSETWFSRIQQTISKYQLCDPLTNEITKNQWHKLVNKAVNKIANDHILKLCQNGSKTVALTKYKQRINRDHYITELPRKLSRILFLIRCNMLPIKSQTSTDRQGLCRLCHKDEETVNHLIDKCEKTREISSEYNVPKLEYAYKNDKTDITLNKELAIFITKTLLLMGIHVY